MNTTEELSQLRKKLADPQRRRLAAAVGEAVTSLIAGGASFGIEPAKQPKRWEPPAVSPEEQSYRALVISVAHGLRHDATEIEAACAAAGRTLDVFAQHLARARRKTAATRAYRDATSDSAKQAALVEMSELSGAEFHNGRNPHEPAENADELRTESLTDRALLDWS